jgi:ABC-type multidrug transport system fused ATPase/permease subunit
MSLWRARSKVISESFSAIKDIILYRAHREMAAQVARHSEGIASAQASTAAIAVSPKYVLECTMAAGLIATALWIYGTVGPGQWLTHLAFLGLAAYRLLPAIQQVFTAIARIRSDRASFERIAEDLRLARQRAAQPQPVITSDEWKGRPRQAIRLSGVSYRHSSERSGGVEDISMTIPAGTLVGFVGPNGSGKTTLADLILGLLKPDTGRIEVDDVPLDDENRDSWLATVAHVPQNIVLLDATVAQNIAFGVAPDDIDLARVLEAAHGARLEPLLDAMPDGLKTVIGQNGIQLSGGQRQRVGIARALYRRASLLVMDEATNALDTLTETEVVALLAALRGKCTTIVIAHRTSSLSGCDLLFKLECGRLARVETFADSVRNSSGLFEREQVLR